MSVKIFFVKMVGAGNDFLLVDTRRQSRAPLRPHWAAVSRALCDRHRGIGADGLLVLEPSTMTDVKMRVFNPDGSEAQMCGNGARCVARYVHEEKAYRPPGQLRQERATPRPKRSPEAGVTIETASGVQSAVVREDHVQMRMPDPTDLRLDLELQVDGRRLRAAFVNTGVPHTVIPVSALDAIDVNRIGRSLRYHRAFNPQGTNVDFIQPDAAAPSRLRVRTYERGVEGETLACGTGVAASAIIHAVRDGLPTGKVRRGGEMTACECRVNVETRSGDLMTVTFTVVPACAPLTGGAGRPNGRGVWVTDLVLEGTARRICEGTVSWPLEGHR